MPTQADSSGKPSPCSVPGRRGGAAEKPLDDAYIARDMADGACNNGVMRGVVDSAGGADSARARGGRGVRGGRVVRGGRRGRGGSNGRGSARAGKGRGSAGPGGEGDAVAGAGEALGVAVGVLGLEARARRSGA